MLHRFLIYLLVLIVSNTALSCKKDSLFTQLSPKDSGIAFINQITENERTNIMTYQYTYNGGGVAVGDLNNDGLSDIYFTGNSVSNSLYLNKGDWKFEDATKEAGLAGRGDWKTGVTMVDINGDGWLDIYVSYSGNAPGEGYNKPVIKNYGPRANQLFINSGGQNGGIPSFTESAKKYGLDATGTFSTQAYFFDYDLDGDLDMFLLNHANMFYSATFNVKRLRNLRHPYFGNKLYRNENGLFVDVTDEAEIHGSGLNFGLSAAISDLNDDGWPDIYVTNDYEEQDFIYINNKDGSFREVSHLVFDHLSKFGMGSDIADLNNDGLPDLVVADMLPEDNYRQKVLEGADEYDKFSIAVDSGYHHQYMRNTLQLNRGLADDGLPRFSEIAQFSGISNTDWSWAPLIADYDNDGLKDIFITNGFLRDLTNLDFVKYEANETIMAANASRQKINLLPLVQKMPSTKISNYIYSNIGNYKFENKAQEWGLGEKTVSNGAVYADLDNDGDLDLVINNLNQPASVYRNNQEKMIKNNFIKILLRGQQKNSQGLGAKIFITLEDGRRIFQEAYFIRGYQSSVEPIFTIGLGEENKLKEVKVLWPDSRVSSLKNISGNQLLEINQKDAKLTIKRETAVNTVVFLEVTAEAGLTFQHKENDYVDFTHQRLLPYQLSRLGGKMAVGDVNRDGNDDVYFGAAAGQTGEIFLGTDDAELIKSLNEQPWNLEEDFQKEDLAATFFDADGDGDLDLYVVSGGNEEAEGSDYYQDRLYTNDGNGNFTKTIDALPNMRFSGGVVVAGDYDNDGDLDLFVGARLKAQNYPLPPKSVILRNDSRDGKIKFTRALENEIGMVTDALWVDMDKDSWLDLVLVGEWMPVTVLKNQKGSFKDVTKEFGLEKTSGWWNSLAGGDFDNDGDMDFLLGNAGNNLKFRASKEEPMRIYIQDLNRDGKLDPILTYYIQGKSYPYPSRDEILGQVASLRKEYNTYDKYGKATVDDILKVADVAPHSVLETNTLKSSFLKNNGEGGFKLESLPHRAQFSAVQGFLFDDFTGDGTKNILAAGNFYPYAVNIGKSDASKGFLLDIEKDELKVNEINNVRLTGDIRDLKIMKFKNGSRRLVVARNNDSASFYKYSNE